MKMSFQASLSKSKKPHAEAEVLAVHAQARLDAGVGEGAAVVAVERGDLLGEIRSDDVQPAVGVEISDADAHAGQGDAILIERAAGRNRDLAEGPVVVVAIQQTRRAVAGDVDVRPAVVVEIRRRRSHAVRARRPPVAADKHHRGGPARTGDARRFRDVGKCAVAAVAIEGVGAAGKSQRPAGDRDVVVAAVRRLTRPRRLRRVEIHIAGHEQIEMAVTVVVQKPAACAPARSGSRHSGLFRDVGERAVAVVVIQDVVPPIASRRGRRSHRCRSRRRNTPAPSRNGSSPAFAVTSVNVPSRLL